MTPAQWILKYCDSIYLQGGDATQAMQDLNKIYADLKMAEMEVTLRKITDLHRHVFVVGIDTGGKLSNIATYNYLNKALRRYHKHDKVTDWFDGAPAEFYLKEVNFTGGDRDGDIRSLINEVKVASDFLTLFTGEDEED